MKKILSLIKEITVLVIIAIFLTYRYINLGVESSQVLYFSFYFCFATFVYFLSRIRYENLINPISIFVPFLCLLSYSFLQLSDEQTTYSIKTFLVINISIIMYLLFAAMTLPYHPVKLFVLNNNLKRKLLYFLCLMAFFTFCLECVIFGYIPMLNYSKLDVYSDTNDKLVPFLHYFITLVSFIPAWAYIFLQEKVISKLEFKAFVIVAALIIGNYLSKQSFLMLGLSFFVAYSFYNKLNVTTILKAIIGIFALFGFVGYLRLDSEMTISAAEYFRAVSGIKNDGISLIEALFVEYSSKRFSILDEMIVFSDKIGYFGFGTYTFRPFTSLLFLEKLNFIQRIPELDAEKRVGTFLIDPYLDYGLFGSFVIISFYGYLASRYYNQFRAKLPEAVVKFSIIVFCMLMGMFVNYFNAMFVLLGFLFNKILLAGFKKKENNL